MASGTQGQAAADWAARLSGEPLEADWLAFEQWLNAAPGHRAAYDRVLALSLAIDRDAAALTQRLEDVGAKPRAFGRRSAIWGASLMTMAAVAVTFVALLPQPQPKATIYATAKGERRDIALSDGTRVALNAGSRLSVVMQPDRRELALVSGEAAFRVVHDPSRPFTVHLGDRVLSDIGTEFDVVRHDGKISITVREGMVAVRRPDDASRSLNLGPGSRLEHHEGSPESLVLASNADDAFAWRVGRLIYRDAALSDVVSDLSRYGEDQVRVTSPAANLRFTGVLTIDNQPAMVQRLTALLPGVASTRKDGVLLLSELHSPR